jgi:uncharacterized phage protein gp47/JayE
MSGLTSSGYSPLRTADYLTIIRESFVAELIAAGHPGDVDWAADTVLGSLTTLMAAELGRLGEMAQAVYDARVPANATGAQLDDLCTLVGVSRLDPTASTATVTLTGTSGTVIPTGAIMQGGGDDGLARWRLDAAVTLASGTGEGTVTSEEEGAIVAAPGDIAQIVTPVAGWTACTNAAAAVTGRDMETDSALRVRRQLSLQITGTGSAASIRAGIAALDYVVSVLVLENDTDADAVISGVTVGPRAVNVIVWPDTLTEEQENEIAETIYRRTAATTATMGSDVQTTVTGADGTAKAVNFDFADQLSVDVDVDVVLASGYALVDVATLIEEAVAAWFEEHAVVGNAIDDADIAEVARVTGVRRLTVLLNSAAYVQPTATQIPAVGMISVAEA